MKKILGNVGDKRWKYFGYYLWVLSLWLRGKSLEDERLTFWNNTLNSKDNSS